ncbi:mannitol dehydrogenase family protein [Marinomonas rhizomae]|uniref:Mannitol 2-dehydrogenase n=1 Tax=Marinomonas rhizomae TaxID=491948 RepID=A0A366JA34_9GAMM|nr:mannitol dehydrogenase family protein [Marinomonas rhizomae]RBP83812.1 mannitol 2-dehydrogenase [Marinomonas rhizomae]RNF73477.1 mannitol dehydrogenase family protein [Marinomonas rhizomae]
MNTTIQLNQKNLHNLPDSFVVPKYDRSQLKAGIVHIGVGGFHRSHEACYNDDFLTLSQSTEWGICGMGLREADRKIGDILKQQDYLYTLIVKHPDGRQENRVIGSIVDFVLASDDPAAATDRLADAQTKIVSLTITEGGYHFNPATNAFDFDHPDVQHDLVNPHAPKMIFGFLTEALRKRRAKGLPAFTIQSCDNIQHNGDMTRKMLLAFAEKQDPTLAQWISSSVSFPNAMVDRITPMTTLQDITLLEEAGVQDLWPVTCEPFTQWIIEDHFSDGRPDWESVGAQFVGDVTPYELMKIRLLNAGHSVLGLLGSVHGHATIDGCIADPLFASYVRRFMDVEVTPILAPVDEINLDEYKSTLIERFGNPNIKDNLARICLESSSKLPKFIVPTIMENLEKGGSIKFAALVIAAWCYYSDKGVSKNGVALDIVDDMKAELHSYASKTEQDSLAFLKLDSVFGDLVQSKTFTDEYVAMVRTLYTNRDIAAQMDVLLGESLLLTA